MLDVGTGSGILALAAQSLGADSVVALDIDEFAIWVALETARQQECPSRVTYVLGPVECLGGAEFDIVMCNMITSAFLPLVGQLRGLLAPAGVAVFSGLLASEVESVSGALTKAGFAITSSRVLGEWASLVGRCDNGTVKAAPWLLVVAGDLETGRNVVLDPSEAAHPDWCLTSATGR